VCEDNFGGDDSGEFGMNYRAEDKEEEKIKHHDLLCKETKGISMKTAEEVHIVGFNLWVSISR
jgi:hypothetical protein